MSVVTGYQTLPHAPAHPAVARGVAVRVGGAGRGAGLCGAVPVAVWPAAGDGGAPGGLGGGHAAAGGRAPPALRPGAAARPVGRRLLGQRVDLGARVGHAALAGAALARPARLWRQSACRPHWRQRAAGARLRGAARRALRARPRAAAAARRLHAQPALRRLAGRQPGRLLPQPIHRQGDRPAKEYCHFKVPANICQTSIPVL